MLHAIRSGRHTPFLMEISKVENVTFQLHLNRAHVSKLTDDNRGEILFQGEPR